MAVRTIEFVTLRPDWYTYKERLQASAFERNLTSIIVGSTHMRRFDGLGDTPVPWGEPSAAAHYQTSISLWGVMSAAEWWNCDLTTRLNHGSNNVVQVSAAGRWKRWDHHRNGTLQSVLRPLFALYTGRSAEWVILSALL
jgi:hypothetical protein